MKHSTKNQLLNMGFLSTRDNWHSLLECEGWSNLTIIIPGTSVPPNGRLQSFRVFRRFPEFWGAYLSEFQNDSSEFWTFWNSELRFGEIGVPQFNQYTLISYAHSRRGFFRYDSCAGQTVALYKTKGYFSDSILFLFYTIYFFTN